MRNSILAAGWLIALSCSAPVLGQTSDPAAANRELIGEGPKVNVQQSAIGTLDVGGAGATNTNVTGENLRGNLGASRPLPGSTLPSTAPKAAIPNFGFQTPDLGAGQRSSASGAKPTKQDLSAVQDIILPRFRSTHEDDTQIAVLPREADGWRYKYFNGRWWYWKPDDSWAYWNGRKWLNRNER